MKITVECECGKVVVLPVQPKKYMQRYLHCILSKKLGSSLLFHKLPSEADL